MPLPSSSLRLICGALLAHASISHGQERVQVGPDPQTLVVLEETAPTDDAFSQLLRIRRQVDELTQKCEALRIQRATVFVETRLREGDLSSCVGRKLGGSVRIIPVEDLAALRQTLVPLQNGDSIIVRGAKDEVIRVPPVAWQVSESMDQLLDLVSGNEKAVGRDHCDAVEKAVQAWQRALLDGSPDVEVIIDCSRQVAASSSNSRVRTVKALRYLWRTFGEKRGRLYEAAAELAKLQAEDTADALPAELAWQMVQFALESSQPDAEVQSWSATVRQVPGTFLRAVGEAELRMLPQRIADQEIIERK